MSKLIGMVGYAQAGKDTFAGYLGYRRLAFADVLKAVAYGCDPIIEAAPIPEWTDLRLREAVDTHGWEYVKATWPEARRFLQLLGTEGAREHLGENVWVDAAFKDYDPAVPTVFTDVRFPNEIAAIRSRGGIIVRIDRHGHTPVNGHVSEFAWQDTPPDEHFVFEVGAFHHMKLVAESLRARL